MGELFVADDRDLDFGVDHHCAVEEVSYYGHVCGVLYCVCVCAEFYYGESLAVGDCAAHRAHVSVVYLFHDHRSEDDREVEEVAAYRGGDCGVRRDDFAVGPGGLCPVLRVVLGGTSGATGRILVRIP